MDHEAGATELVHRFRYRNAVMARFVLSIVGASGILLATGLVSVAVTAGSLIGGIFGISTNSTVEISARGVRLGRRSWQSWEEVRFTRKRGRDILILGSGRRAPKVPLRYFATTWRTDEIGAALHSTVPPGQLRIDLSFDAAPQTPPPPPGYIRYEGSAQPI